MRQDDRPGDLGSHTGFRTAPSGGFPCGFSVVDRLGSFHEAGQAVGLRGRLSSGFGPKKPWYPYSWLTISYN